MPSFSEVTAVTLPDYCPRMCRLRMYQGSTVGCVKRHLQVAWRSPALTREISLCSYSTNWFRNALPLDRSRRWKKNGARCKVQFKTTEVMCGSDRGAGSQRSCIMYSRVVTIWSFALTWGGATTVGKEEPSLSFRCSRQSGANEIPASSIPHTWSEVHSTNGVGLMRVWHKVKL